SREMCACRKRRPTASRCWSTISNASAAKLISASPPKSFSVKKSCARVEPNASRTRTIRSVELNNPEEAAMADDAARSRLGRGLAALMGDVGAEAKAHEHG